MHFIFIHHPYLGHFTSLDGATHTETSSHYPQTINFKFFLSKMIKERNLRKTPLCEIKGNDERYIFFKRERKIIMFNNTVRENQPMKSPTEESPSLEFTVRIHISSMKIDSAPGIDFERRETLKRWTINDLLVFESRETLRRLTINDLLGWSTKAGLLLLRILNCDKELRPT